MKTLTLFLAILIFSIGCNTQSNSDSSKKDSTAVAKEAPASVQENIPFKPDVPDAQIQIKLALLAAPPEKKDSATVYGYDTNGQLVILRKGTNEMICLADKPNDSTFSVACYKSDLEPLMQRGRELREQGIKGQQLEDERAKEVKEGILKMPDGPSTLYVYSADAKDVNRATGEVKKGALRYVIYTPFATAASTGLPTKPSAPGMPWIMDPGTYKSHIMITP